MTEKQRAGTDVSCSGSTDKPLTVAAQILHDSTRTNVQSPWSLSIDGIQAIHLALIAVYMQCIIVWSITSITLLCGKRTVNGTLRSWLIVSDGWRCTGFVRVFVHIEIDVRFDF